MMNSGTSVIFLPCRDIKKTEAFYHDVLGLSIIERQSDNLVIFDTGYGYWGFCQYSDGRSPLSGPQGVCLSLNLDSEQAVSEAFGRFKDQCHVYKEPARHPRFPVFSFFLLDPDGYMVVFQKTGMNKS